MTDAELYRRGSETLLASWQAYACGSVEARLLRAPGVAAAVFPAEPERSVYNNALLERDLADGERAHALEKMEAAYTGAGVARFAAWAHETDVRLCADLEARGYRLDTTTRAMGMSLDRLNVSTPEIELGSLDWDEYLRVFELPAGLLSRADHTEFRVLVARLDGEDAATAMAYDLDGDSGIYNVGTLERFRRRGLGTALTALHLHRARERGCRTASLQATEAAERMYARVGFRDLGRILEFVPG